MSETFCSKIQYQLHVICIADSKKASKGHMLHGTSQKLKLLLCIVHASLLCCGKQLVLQNISALYMSSQGQICTGWQCMHDRLSVRAVLSITSNSNYLCVFSADQMYAYLFKQL